MKKIKKIRNRILLLICIVAFAVILAIPISSLYSKKQIEKIASMTAKECLNYTLQDNDNAVITIGILHNGESSWTVYGKNETELSHELHTYEIGSLTKTMTATLIADAVEDEKINLDDTIDCYLELPEGNVYPTIKELLTHTSGYKEYYYESPMMSNFLEKRNSFYGITDEMLLNRLGKISTENADKSWKYSNFGYATLGLILEKIYNDEYTNLANNFLKDYEMMNSHISTGEGDLNNYWDWNNGDAYLSAGAVVSNIEDMLIYAQYQLENKGLFAETHNLLENVSATPDEYAMLDMRVDAMGMSWIIDEDNGFIWHNGASGNYNSYLGFCLKTKTAVVVLSNLPSNNRISATIIGIKLLKEMQ